MYAPVARTTDNRQQTTTIMFRRLKNLCYRYVFQQLTIRAVIGALVVYSLLKGLKHGVIYYQNFERFYVKVRLILYINIFRQQAGREC